MLGGIQPQKMHGHVLGYLIKIFQLVFKRLLNSTFWLIDIVFSFVLLMSFTRLCKRGLKSRGTKRYQIKQTKEEHSSRASWWNCPHLLFLNSEKTGLGVSGGYLIFYFLILQPFHLRPQNWQSFVYSINNTLSPVEKEKKSFPSTLLDFSAWTLEVKWKKTD